MPYLSNFVIRNFQFLIRRAEQDVAVIDEILAAGGLAKLILQRERIARPVRHVAARVVGIDRGISVGEIVLPHELVRVVIFTICSIGTLIIECRII